MDNLEREHNPDFEIQTDFYTVLDVPKHASQMMIREAYVQRKATYIENNPAFYSLGIDSHRQENLLEVERAYALLMDPDKREIYNQELIQKKIATLHDFHPLLQRNGASAREAAPIFERKNLEFSTRSTPALLRRRVCEQGSLHSVQEKYEKIIAAGDPSDGTLYRLLREIAQVSLDQMHLQTKVSVEHFFHIEVNKWESLPQPIYVKGFLHSYFEFLGVKDHNRLVEAFITRYENWVQKEKSKS
jgi:hypothetical protein